MTEEGESGLGGSKNIQLQLQQRHELVEHKMKKNERKPRITIGSNPSCHILAGAVQCESLFSISLFGKQQSSTKPIRSNDLNVGTDIQQLKLRLTHPSGNHSHFPFFFTLMPVLLQKKKKLRPSLTAITVSIISPITIQTAPFKENVVFYLQCYSPH